MHKWRCEVCGFIYDESSGLPEDGIAPGEITMVTKKTFAIACGQDALQITRLQPEGKKPMDAAAFLAGNKLTAGEHI